VAGTDKMVPLSEPCRSPQRNAVRPTRQPTAKFSS